MSTVDSWFDTLTPEQQELLRRLRELILTNAPEAKEEIKWGQPCYSQHKLFAYLAKAKGHVTLGFQQGAHLADPLKLLEGEGKNMRAIRFPLGGAIDEAGCVALIKAAVAIDQSR